MKTRSARNCRPTAGTWTCIDIEGPRVTIALRAMCTDCPMGSVTVEGIQQRLRDVVDKDIVVVAQ